MEALIFDLVKDSIGSLLQATAGFISQKLGQVRGLEADLKKLQKELVKVHALLLGAESKLGFGSPEFENPLLREWVKEVAQVAYRAEDVMDEYAYELLKHKFDSEDMATKPLALRLRSKVRLFSSDSPVVFRHRMAQEVKSLRESIAEIYANAKDLGINPSLVAAGASLPSSSDRDAISAAEKQLQWRRENVDYEGLIGREEFIEQIKKELREASNSDKRLTVIGIYGMGGSGKTAVSRNMFKAAEVKEYFQEQIWICVSHDFDFKELLKRMLQQLGGQSSISDDEAINNSLRAKLQGKKFFLVLDDVWDTFPAAWEPFRCCLQDMNELKGNTILVTSRSKDVLAKLETYNASMQSIDDPCIHELPGLTKEDSWSLFKHRVGDDMLDSTKATLARKVLEKCGGVPLAIRTVGDLLRSQGIHTWVEIEASGIWNEHDNITLPSIKLSFKYLPSVALKKCFVYCAIFREDQVIKKDMLIQLWMAQGFLQHPRDELEQVGEKYFYDLLNNSLFQDPVFDAESGNVVGCKMHDVVHDLARALSSNDITQQVRHLSLLGDKQCDSSLEAGNNLRTLLLSYNLPKFKNLSENMIKYLRALILDSFGTEELPDSIGELKHLRYLNLNILGIKSLPVGLVKLYNLQTLRIDHKFPFVKSGFPVFPKGLNKLVNLRHVCSYSFGMGIPVGLGMLTSLQTLPTINASEQWGGKLSELQTLSKLKGLRIIGLQHVEVQEAKEVKLGMKNNINELFLSWDGRDPTGDDLLENEKMVLEALQPHANLSSLEIHHYDAKEFPPWVREMTGWGGSPFSNLVRLEINHCFRLEHLPTSLKNLVALKQLIILTNRNAISLPSHLECLTSLQELQLIDCNKMENIVADISPLVNLRKVIIRGCPNMTCLPTGISDLPRLEELDIGGFGWDLDMFPFPTTDTNGNGIIGRSKFKSLVKLYLCGGWHGEMREVKSLPNSMQYLNQLRHLRIRNLGGLEALPEWLGNLTSLRELELKNLRNLKSMPSRAAIRHLTKLLIDRCPQLEKACVRETGAEWPKLQHIPDISINGMPLWRYEELLLKFSKGPSNLSGFINYLSV